MAHFFNRNWVSSVHHRQWMGPPRVGLRGHDHPTLYQLMTDNVDNGRPLLFDLSRKFMFYADFGREYVSDDGKRPWHELIVEQYPNSKFLLQIRHIHKWLHSRYMHSGNGGFLMDRQREHKKQSNETESEVQQQEIAILRKWKRDWYRYMCDLISYLEQRNLKDNLLIYDIERDSPQRIASYFEQFNLTLNPVKYKHDGDTKDKTGWKLARQSRKWDEIVAQVPEFGDFSDNIEGEIARIWMQCHAVCD